MEKTRCTNLMTAAVTVLMIASGAAAHEPGDSGQAGEATTVEPPRVRDWSLRFGFIVAETSGETSLAVDPGTVDVSLSGGGGGFVSLERKVSPLLGLEFGLTGINADMNVSAGGGHKHWGTDVEFLSMAALTLAANFHFAKTGAIDAYAGPMLVFNRYSKWTVRTGVDDGWWPNRHHDDDWVSVQSKDDSEVTWGAKAGIDIFLNKKKSWTLSGSLAFIDATYDFDEDSGEGRGSIDLDPVMFGFGVGYRF